MTSRTVRTRRDHELGQVRRIAEAAQEVLLRPVPARLGPVRAASMYLAAETGAQIGGDLYDAVQTRYGIRLIVGDVRGKGLPAVRAAAVVLGAFRESVHYEDDLVEVVRHCGAALRRDAATPGAGLAQGDDVLLEGFVTTLVAQVPDTLDVQVVNRGHPPPLLLHTDGVIEARDGDNAFFDLAGAMEKLCDRTRQSFLEGLRQALLRHARGRLADDVAVVLVDRVG